MHGRQRGLLLRELFVEVAGISAAVLLNSFSNAHQILTGGAYNGREVRGWDALVEDIVEADVLEEWVLLDLPCILFT